VLVSELCSFCAQANPPGTIHCVACGGALIALHILSKGTTLRQGRYLLGRVLGEGGFGITYQGTDLNLGRAVALKEFFPQGSSRHGTHMIPPPTLKGEVVQQMLREFLTEASQLAQFAHPHIVSVFDSFEENNTAYMVMDYLRGQTLEDTVLQMGPLVEARVIIYLQQVGSALEQVHSRGLLHRDIKPGNIILTHEDRAVLIDFGAAREFVEGTTQRQTQIVTNGFAPPEQYALQARRGSFTDIYALAATAYYLLSAQIPVGSMDRLFGNELVDLSPELSPHCKKAVLTGMALRVEERPATVTEFLKLLQPPEFAVRKALSVPIWLRPRVVQSLTGLTTPVTALAFQPGGDLLAGAAQDGFLLWDLESGQRQGALATDGSERLSVCFSPDGQALYTASIQGQVSLWDVAARRIYHALSRLASQSQALAFSPDGVFLAIGSEEGGARGGAGRPVIKLIALNDGSCYWTFRGHRGAVTALAFALDGTLLSGSRDGTVRLWQVGQEHSLLSLNIGRSVPAVTVHPDNQQIALGTADGSVQLWQARENRLIAQNQQPLAPVTAMAFHPAGYLLGVACGGLPGQWGAGVHLWDVVTSRQRLNSLASPIRQAVTSLSFSQDGRYLAGGTTLGTVQVLTNT